MGRLKVGVMIESFRLGVKPGIRKAAEIGADGFQIYVTKGEAAPWNLSQTGRRDFKRFVEGLGLKISALCGDLGHGYTDPAKMDELVDKSKQILQLSYDLGVPVVTTHIGVIPADEDSRTWSVLTDALKELAGYGEEVGSCLATETGPEDTKLMRKFLDNVNSPGLKVNYDPANLVMNGFDHLGGVKDLADYIVHTHAKDGVRLPDAGHKEVPLGEGQVKWPEYLANLESVGYEGFFIVEREVGSDPLSDIIKAVKFLRSF